MSFSLMRTVVAVLGAGLLLSACASGARSDFGLNEREAASPVGFPNVRFSVEDEAEAPEEATTNVVDFMSLLQQSLDAKKRTPAKKAAASPRAPAKAAKAPAKKAARKAPAKKAPARKAASKRKAG